MLPEHVLQTYHLPSLPTRKLRLVPIPDPDPDPSPTPDYEELLLTKGWFRLGPGEGKAILDLLWSIWQSRTDYQRNCLVCQALGSQPNGGAVPPWSTSLNMTRLLIERVQSDWFPLDDFSDVLYHLLSDEQGFGNPENGQALALPDERALHFFTLLVAAQQPSVLAFTFVAVYKPTLLLQAGDDDPTLVLVPRTPAPSDSAALSL